MDKIKQCMKWHESRRESKWLPPVQIGDIHLKKSCGVILCKGRQFLLIKKRYTYEFSDFVNSKYDTKYINLLLTNMTREELLIILSLNFEMMWYHLTLKPPNGDVYTSKLAKFMHHHMRDNGTALTQRIKATAPIGVIPWELPKGHLEAREFNVMCAVRELEEETGISKSNYYIIPGATIVDCFMHANTKYYNLYYVGVIYECAGRKDLMMGSVLARDASEIGDIQWMSLDELSKNDDRRRHLKRLLTPALNIIKKYGKGKWLRRF